MPHHIDEHVGRRLKSRRLLLGISQERMGELLGLTFQQIQKYERGANRIGASRLYEAAQALDVDVNYFFAEVPGAATGLAEAGTSYLPEAPAEAAAETRRDALELQRAYERIADPERRRRLLDLAKALAAYDEDHRPRP